MKIPKGRWDLRRCAFAVEWSKVQQGAPFTGTDETDLKWGNFLIGEPETGNIRLRYIKDKDVLYIFTPEGLYIFRKTKLPNSIRFILGKNY